MVSCIVRRSGKTMEFARFMATNVGRLLRVMAGMILVLLALMLFVGLTRILLVGLGALLIAGGTFNFCFIAPLIGAPFWGKDLK